MTPLVPPTILKRQPYSVAALSIFKLSSKNSNVNTFPSLPAFDEKINEEVRAYAGEKLKEALSSFDRQERQENEDNVWKSTYDYMYSQISSYEKAISLDLASYDDSSFYSDFILAIETSSDNIRFILTNVRGYVAEIVSFISIGAIMVSIDPVCLIIILVFVQQRHAQIGRTTVNDQINLAHFAASHCAIALVNSFARASIAASSPDLTALDSTS